MNATWKQNSPKAKKQTIKFFLFFLHSPVTFTGSLSLSPLSLNGPNPCIISIKTKGTKDVSSVQPKGKKKKKSYKTSPIFYLIIFHIELSQHQDQSLLAGENRCLSQKSSL